MDSFRSIKECFRYVFLADYIAKSRIFPHIADPSVKIVRNFHRMAAPAAA
jgi:hypothetical protein